ncbi:hypothetical protein E1263_07530 [Kribbella antibiotica]|uniref:Uncharacterized protein n=1 Tax=Kribbella antibiotica TaxID=190195 RepID=A0A4R4ZW18_9ACTN|nr:hypothetical protein [Kribbella antibiotica]TDD61352.1 hypothetical protein E1263_07530 [Kribbella antibiotica]
MGKIFGMKEVATVAYPLGLVYTFGGLLTMPSFVGADWPEWGSMMVMIGLTVLPVAWFMVSAGTGAASVGRWIALAAVLVAILRLLWVVYDSGPVPTLAVVPLLAVLFGVAVFLVYTWPKSASRELKELAARHGWQVVRAKNLRLPMLPLPVGVAWSAKDAVQTPTGVAFEVRWVKWHWLVAHRYRLSAFVRLLDVRLPTLEVRPGGLSRSDVTLESGEFNRSFDVLGDDPRYLTATLHPRNLQALLDARPMALAIDGTVLALYDDSPLADSLTRGMQALDRLTIPRHVAADWGQYASSNQPRPGLAFRNVREDLSYGGMLLRLFGFATGLLGLTWLGCFAAVSIYGS